MKKIVLIIGVLAVGGIGVATYMWNKPHRDVVSEKAEASTKAASLLTEFQTDEIKANQLYLDKVIEVQGQVLEVLHENGTTLILKTDDDFFGISCHMDSTIAIQQDQYPTGTNVSVKGRCTGFNGFEVVLTQCSMN